MFDENTQFEFKLSNPIKIAKNGMEEECDTLVLHEPTIIHINLLSRMKPIIMKSFYEFVVPLGKQMIGDNADNQDNNIQDSDDDMSEVVNMAINTCQEYEKYQEYFQKLLLTSGICTINDEKFLSGYISQLSLKDYELIIKQYTAKFIFPKDL